MSTTTQTPASTREAQSASELTAGQLPKFTTLAVAVVALALAAGLTFLIGAFSIAMVIVVATLLFLILAFIVSTTIEGVRKAKDRLATQLVFISFVLALLPLISVTYETINQGRHRFDLEFFTSSMRGVLDDGGGAAHALVGTFVISGIATLIAVPIGMLTAVYLVEYARGSKLAGAITFFVDVMTGIPSIVAGLFAYTGFAIILGPGTKLGIIGAVALTVLMIPVVVRSTEEMLRIVPNELREASYALGVPKWRTILKVVIPTSLGGIITGVILAIARVAGETAPLLVTAGLNASMNWNALEGWMTALPVFVFEQYTTGADVKYTHRAWTGALTLIIIVMVLNAIGRAVAAKFAPKTGR